MLQMSTFEPYLLLLSSSGAAYAGLPHCVTHSSFGMRLVSLLLLMLLLMFTEFWLLLLTKLLRPKSVTSFNSVVVHSLEK